MHKPVSTAWLKPPSRYGERRLNPLALGLAVLIHIGIALLLLIFQGPIVEAVRHAPLVVTNIPLDPPPPPPSQPEPSLPDPPPPAAYVPRPALILPVPSQPVLTTVSEPSPPAPQPAAETASTGAPTPAPAPRPVEAGDLSSSMIAAPPPRYPHESRRRREQGTVLLAVVLSTDGTVLEVRIARSSGHTRLDEAARNAVRKWRWSPTVRGGVAVQVRGTVEVDFVLPG